MWACGDTLASGSNVIFKLALDHKGIYTSNEYAAKSAGTFASPWPSRLNTDCTRVRYSMRQVTS